MNSGNDNDDEKAKLEAAKKANIKGDYLGFMNGRNFISTKNISKDAAYANCKLNAANNPKVAVYCTFNGQVIFGVKM